MRILLSGVTPRVARILSRGQAASLPDPDALLRLLRPVDKVLKYGVYLKLAIPASSDSNLPVLGYVGSATGFHGLDGRKNSHYQTMRSGKL